MPNTELKLAQNKKERKKSKNLPYDYKKQCLLNSFLFINGSMFSRLRVKWRDEKAKR